MPNIDGLVWLGNLTHVSEDISAPHTWINLRIAALEPCCPKGHVKSGLSAVEILGPPCPAHRDLTCSLFSYTFRVNQSSKVHTFGQYLISFNMFYLNADIIHVCWT